MNQLERVKDEIAIARENRKECDLRGFPLQSAHYKEIIDRKLEEYVALLEAEVKNLNDQIKADYWPGA